MNLQIPTNLCNCVKKPEKNLFSGFFTQLHSSVGRASHWYCEVMGLNPIEVLNFFQASLHNCINCISLRRSFLHFISFRIDLIAPNVSGFIAQLVEHRTVIVRSQVQTPLKS